MQTHIFSVMIFPKVLAPIKKIEEETAGARVENAGHKITKKVSQ